MTQASVSTPARTWTVEEIRLNITTKPDWTARAVVAIWQRQTNQEQQIRETRDHNGVGFNGVDAEIMSSFAEQISRGRTLSPKQLAIAQRKIRKYAGQLVKIINNKI